MTEPESGRTVRSVDDLMRLLDRLVAPRSNRWGGNGGGAWWDAFYADRARPVPFFEAKPDENLVEVVEEGLVGAGRVLDVGAGPGRNAVYLDSAGFAVDAVDLSPEAVRWAQERARQAGAGVRFLCADVLTESTVSGPYDFVYDSGCFHHLPPHRRISYLSMLDRVLAPGGYFGLVCFARGQMGTTLPDEQLYRDGDFEAGVGYGADDLRWVFADYEVVQIRPMRPQAASSPTFGRSFLLTALFRRGPEPASS